MWSEKRQRWIGRISAGYRPDGKRRVITLSAKTKTEAQAKVRKALREVESGQIADRSVTVADAAKAWLETGLPNRSAATVENRTSLVLTHVVPGLGSRRLVDLTPEDVDRWLDERSAILARSSLQRILSLLRQILRRAMARGLVHRNVAELCEPPTAGRPGRPSKSLTLDQAVAVLQEADAAPVMDAYVHLSILTGARTEELRALRWADVDLDAAVPSASFVRSVRHGGDTKTATSRRRLELASRCVEVLRRHRRYQAGQRLQAEAWADRSGLVFTTSRGTPLDAANVRRSFRAVVDRVDGMTGSEWTPQELRHSFVSLLSEAGVAVEEIAHLVGHANTRTTEKVYRKELRPVLRPGAAAMNALFRPTDPPRSDGVV
ncbi:site-specific integrase [Enemella evansiae]|nr:site-specific integrase [Enemella evansiae]